MHLIHIQALAKQDLKNISFYDAEATVIFRGMDCRSLMGDSSSSWEDRVETDYE
jgi:hypothetical protein